MEVGAIILGVDGGGTNTRTRLARVEPHGALTPLADGHAAGSNPLSQGFTASVEAIRSATHSACGLAGITVDGITSAVFGIAGAGSTSVAVELSTHLQAARLGRIVKVLSDVEALLAASAGEATMVLISGTGSACYAHSADGPTISAGGWGYLIDDDGSGFWLGQQMLRHCIAACECDGNPSLEPAVLTALNVTDLAAVKSAIYGDLAQARAKIASLSRPLCELASSGDGAAHGLVAAAAKMLATRAIRTGQRAKLPPGGYKLQLTGGVLLACELLRDEVVAEVEKELRPAEIILAPNSVDACLKLARDQIRS
jgi:N-acetylglucosamine kinase-like BadF-type ATPase